MLEWNLAFFGGSWKLRGNLCILASLVFLVSCATPPEPVVRASTSQEGELFPYPSRDGFLECVPFARTVSGIGIRGDAWTWWDRADGIFWRGSVPRVGAVLAFKRDNSLRSGHVAVVVQLSNPREILVTHANWGSDGDTRGVVHERQPVMDVSPANDWTAVRLMNTKGTFGRTYPAHGFIYQPQSKSSSVAGLRP